MMLALRLGRTLQELGRDMTSEELTLWRAFDETEPLRDWRHDLGFGVVAATVANMSGKTRASGSEDLVPRDFMPLARSVKRGGKSKSLSAAIRGFFSGLAKREPKE